MSNDITTSAPYNIVFTDHNGMTQDVDGATYGTLEAAEEALDAWRESDSADDTLRIVDCNGVPLWSVGDAVQAGDTTDNYDHGKVLAVDGDRVLVAWAGNAEKHWCPAELVEPHNPDKESLAAELRGEKDIVLTPQMLRRWTETGECPWEATS